MVTVPPRMAQKPIGISNRDMGKPERADIRLTTGIKSAAAPTFCINEEITATVLEIIGMMRFSVLPPTFKMKAATVFIMPVRSRPAPIIITAMIDITALLEKPRKRYFVSTSPSCNPIQGAIRDVRPSNTIIEIAATSTGTISNTNK